MPNPFKILIVDDEFNVVESLADVLEQSHYQVGKAYSGEEALKILRNDPDYNLVIVDLLLPKMDGLELMAKIREQVEKRPALIVITGHGSVDSAVKAMKLGAEDYLLKPVNPEELLLIIEKERQRQQLVDQNAYFMQELCEKYKIENLVGRSSAMLDVFEKAKLLATSNAPTMIIGESGSGKELFANHIHYAGIRAQGPLIKVSCATLAPGVVESELFGHEKGAFTGAFYSKRGRIELADGGTLFLDEIGDIPLPSQTKLLRVLESQEFERVGSNRMRKSDFRIISATNHNLREDIKRGLFRSDLFYRLATVEIELPPLRERPEDILLLLDHFIQIYSQKTGKAIIGSTTDLLPVLAGYSWPGNVRELKNVVERAFVYCRENVIGIQHLPQYIHNPERKPLNLSELPIRSLEDLEKGLIELCLWEARGNRSQAAQKLGIARQTLQTKMKKYGLSSMEELEPGAEN